MSIIGLNGGVILLKKRLHIKFSTLKIILILNKSINNKTILGLTANIIDEMHI